VRVWALIAGAILVALGSFLFEFSLEPFLKDFLGGALLGAGITVSVTEFVYASEKLEDYRRFFKLMGEQYVRQRNAYLLGEWFVNTLVTSPPGPIPAERRKKFDEFCTLLGIRIGELGETLQDRFEVWEQIARELRMNQSSLSLDAATLGKTSAETVTLMVLGKSLSKEQKEEFMRLMKNLDSPNFVVRFAGRVLDNIGSASSLIHQFMALLLIVLYFENLGVSDTKMDKLLHLLSSRRSLHAISRDDDKKWSEIEEVLREFGIDIGKIQAIIASRKMKPENAPRGSTRQSEVGS